MRPRTQPRLVLAPGARGTGARAALRREARAVDGGSQGGAIGAGGGVARGSGQPAVASFAASQAPAPSNAASAKVVIKTFTHVLHGFLLCGFLLSLAYTQQGDPTRAARWFERNRAACGPAGLLSEEFDPVARRQLGNFPQALTHLGIVSAALTLAEGRSIREPE